jgi:hypothetical protein
VVSQDRPQTAKFDRTLRIDCLDEACVAP